MKKQKVFISLDGKEDVFFAEIGNMDEEQVCTLFKEKKAQGFSQLIFSTEIILDITKQLFSNGYWVSACSFFEENFLPQESEETRKETTDQLLAAMRLFPTLKRFWISWLEDQVEKSSLIIRNISFAKELINEIQEPEITIFVNGTIVVKDELKEALKGYIKESLC